MEVIQINKFSYLDDDKKIFFSKIDNEYLLPILDKIRNVNHDVVLITGNSDNCVTDWHLTVIPDNVKVWFAQNKNTDNPLVQSLPIGLTNTIACKRSGHGYVWTHYSEVPNKLISASSRVVSNFDNLIYCNFNVNTNLGFRTLVKNICTKQSHVTCKDPTLSFDQYITDILNHKAVVCAQGNGDGDNHRIYETLYLKRIPITFNKKQYEYIHYLYPILLLHDVNQLTDKEWLEKEINKLSAFDYNMHLDYNTWKSKILSYL